MTVLDRDRHMTKLLEGSLALVRLPLLQSELERLRLEKTTLHLCLEVSSELLAIVHEFTNEAHLGKTLDLIRDVLRQVQK